MYPHRPYKSSISSVSFKSTVSNCLKSLGSEHVFNDNLIVLGIETSCDDTAAAVVSKSVYYTYTHYASDIPKLWRRLLVIAYLFEIFCWF